MFLIVFKALFTEFCNCASAKKIVMLIRIRHTCVAFLYKKTVLSLETSSEINFEFIKFVKKGKCLPLTKTNREYYINVTFPDWVIVENIILRNVIITFPEMIFSTITQSENVLCIILYRILDPLFSIVIGLPWWGEFQRENDAQPLIYMHEWKKSFTKMALLSSLNAQTDHDVRSNKLRHKKSTTPNLIPSSAS